MIQRRRRRRAFAFLLLCCCLFAVITTTVVITAAAAKTTTATSSSSTTETTTEPCEWEGWDYYRMLGLHHRNATANEIRKAYRSQAKRYHPDKRIYKNNTAAGASTTTTTTTTASSSKSKNKNKITHQSAAPVVAKEEANSRFARIAEAYQVLASDEKRQHYDKWLLHKEHYDNLLKSHPQASSYDDYGSHYDDYGEYDEEDDGEWEFVFEEDPFMMFEDLFTEDFDPYDESYLDEATLHNNYAQQQQQQQQPIRIMEEQQTYIDEMSGQEFVRVIQTQQYGDGTYKIIGQDFMDVYDPYRHVFVYQPIQNEPFLLEEGIADTGTHNIRGDYDDSDEMGGEWGRTQQQQKQRTRSRRGHGHNHDHYHEARRPWNIRRSILGPDEYLTVEQALVQPPYSAGLTPNCDLAVVRNHYVVDKDEYGGGGGNQVLEQTVMWSPFPQLLERSGVGGTHIHVDDDDDDGDDGGPPPPLFGGNCRLELIGQRLAVTTMTKTPRRELLWLSSGTADNAEEDDLLRLEADAAASAATERYIARLDADASLSVYRLEEPSKVWLVLAQKTKSIPYVRRIVHSAGALFAIDDDEEGGGTSTNPAAAMTKMRRLVCVYSTGPARCFRLGRVVVHWGRGIGRQLGRILS